MADKDLIKKNFSKYARYYDSYSGIQHSCAEKLILMADKKDIRAILDIGCGTGNYTLLLRKRFPKAAIKALDLSPDMIDIAKEKLKCKRTDFVAADAETADFKEKFDLIGSNATFQWFESLKEDLLRYRTLLKRPGLITFSTFGPGTFCELDASLKEVFGPHVNIASCGFMGHKELSELMSGIFKDAVIEERMFKERYNCLSDLLKTIKYTGVRGEGADIKSPWSQRMLEDLEKIYVKKFGYILATYQVFFCKGAR